MTTSTEVRENLQSLLERDLMGPWDGSVEVLDRNPRSRYLVGMLAPMVVDPALTELVDRPSADDPGASQDSDPQAVIPTNADDSRGVRTGSDEDINSGDVRDNEDDRPVSGALVFSSSMGLRCQVPLETAILNITARWGRYSQQPGEKPDGTKFTERPREQVEVHSVVNLTRDSGQIPLRDGEAALVVETAQDDNRLVVEIALLNMQRTGKDAPPENWMFQTELVVTAPDGSAIFLPTRDPLTNFGEDNDEELRHLQLLYRDRLEFAIGRTCSVHAVEAPHERRATEVRTTWLPTADVPQTVAAGAQDAMLDMQQLAEADADDLRSGLTPLVDGYGTWLSEQAQLSKALPPHLQVVADEAIEAAGWSASRLTAGLALLTEDGAKGDGARLAFAFMNTTMREQRIQSQVAAARTVDPKLSISDARTQILSNSKAAMWRPFQLAFILIQLPALVDPTSGARSESAACAELLFFPTGGGKTEAYLGIAALTFAIRRMQGTVDSADGPLNGGAGVAVIMRYTLRLLTSQQFLRATTLVCAAELERLKNPELWGDEPFRIGLWVGSNVSPKSFDEAKAQINEAKSDSWGSHGLTVLQVKRCPWCGHEITAARNVVADDVTRRVYVRCGDPLGVCPFGDGGLVGDGLPILTTDEEIYRHPPTYLLATVDKFARLAREGQAASIFGYVRERCPRHGYRHPDSNQSVCGSGSNHQKKVSGAKKFLATTVQTVDRLRPPDLIIQDELHLISGALGTAVGLFETAVDTLCSWETTGGKPVRPLVVASTATVRNAVAQVRGLYGRSVAVFPPQVLDVADTYFSKEIPIDADHAGRRYFGVCAQGIRLTLAEIRMAELLLLVGQTLFDTHGDAADPYMTLVGYFNATRELAGMRRYIDDDVTTRVSAPNDFRGFHRRTSTGLNVGELTARISSGDIAKTLDRLGTPFDPEVMSTAARQRWSAERKAALAAKKHPPRRPDNFPWPFDVVLATSMLQVGVDVPRLGLMLVVGQPKNTAEYIQASSRVGRVPQKPGFVVTLANWARPRDMAHFEQFEYYHQTFYAQVEALSVTPYSAAAMDRGLTAVLVSAARVVDAASPEPSLTSKRGAKNVSARSQVLNKLIEKISSRAGDSDRAEQTHDDVRSRLTIRKDKWTEIAGRETLAYDKVNDQKEHIGVLLVSPEVTQNGGDRRLFKVANSMREVQPEINLLVTPAKPAGEPVPNEPQWEFPATGASPANKGGESS